MKQLSTILMLFLANVTTTLGQDLTVATFNAEFLNTKKVHMKFGLGFNMDEAAKEDREFWNDPENRSVKFREASSLVAAFLKGVNADVLTLTEVGDSADIQVLVDEFEKIGIVYSDWAVCNCTDTYTGQHVAVLSKFPLINIEPQISGRSIYLEEVDGDSEGETSLSKGMMVTAQVDGKEIDVFVLHLKSERGGFESDAKRLAQASIARRAIIKKLNQERNLIVTGDLNSEKGSETIYRVRGFDDIYEELIQTGHSRYFEDKQVRWTYNYLGEREQIDHILISTSLANKDDIHTSIIEVTDDRISDHNPVIVKLKLN